MFTTSYDSRTDAIQIEIVEAIEATGVIENAEAAYDIDAIADGLIISTGAGYQVNEDVDFWAVVANYEIAN